MMSNLHSKIVKDFPGKSIKHVRLSSKPIIQVADRAKPKLQNALVDTIVAVRNSIDVKALADQIAHKNIHGALEVLNLLKRFGDAIKGAGIHPGKDSLLTVVQNTVHDGVKTGMLVLDKVPIVQKAKAKPTVGASMSFDMSNPKAIQFLQSYTFDLIQGISSQSQNAIQDALINAFDVGGSPADLAQDILSQIGLTQKQVGAVKNFRSMLSSGDVSSMRQALQRSLRDARSDPTVLRAIANKTALPKSVVNSMTDKYAARSVAARADTIARTETIRASNAGQNMAWKEARDQGFLDDTARMEWIVSDDEALCDLCDSIPDDNEGGVGLDEPFDTDIGDIDYPPAHPDCRCSVGLVFEK